MKGYPKSVASFAIILIIISNPAVATNMQPGKWKMTTQVEMPGMPIKMPQITYHKCLTKKDLVPTRNKTDSRCKMIYKKITDDNLTWKMKCDSQKSRSTMEGKVTYTGKTMKGTIDMNNGGQHMTQRISGQWVGTCN